MKKRILIIAGTLLFLLYLSSCNPRTSLLPGFNILSAIQKNLLHQEIIGRRGLIKKYKVAMPLFKAVKDNELNSIIAFLHTHKLTGRQVHGDGKV